MNFFYKRKDRNNSGKNFLGLVVFALFSNFSAFAQTTVVNSTFDVVTNEASSKVISISILNSNDNFILWFMGTKETPNKVISPEGMSTKKGLISSGVEPNHLLMRTLLKKTVNIKFC